MTSIVAAGSINQLALGSPKAVVALQTPEKPIVGAQTNILGFIGVASWGPVNVPTVVGGNDQQNLSFGLPAVRRYDLGTAVLVATDQFCSSMKCVRVTDSTDVAASGTYATNELFETVTVSGTISNGDSASVTFTPTVGSAVVLTIPIVTADTTTTVAAKITAAVQANASLLAGGVASNSVGAVCNIYYPASAYTFGRTSGSNIVFTLGSNTLSITKLTLSGLYTGTVGNGITGSLLPGTKASTTQIRINRPGFVSEAFDNIAGTGNLLWVAIANALNNGVSDVRGPSVLCVATAGLGAAVGPSSTQTITLSGGLDGATGVVDSTLLGTDVAPRKGLYSLRGQGVSVAAPVDATTATYWPSYASFGEGEGVEVIVATAAGDTVTAAATELSSAGVDSWGLTVAFGDWLYYWDTVNKQQRLLSPASFIAAKRANLSPEQSVLNKPLNNIIGSQKSLSNGVWSDADRDALYNARMELVANPAQGGAYWAAICGVNSSSNAAINGDNYTQMTSFIARSVAQWAGSNIGLLQTPTQRTDAKAQGDAFFSSLWSLGMIGNADSFGGKGVPPWSVRIDDTTTPLQMASLGYEIAAVRVTYLAVIRWFVVNLMGGQTVQVTVADAPPAFLAS